MKKKEGGKEGSLTLENKVRHRNKKEYLQKLILQTVISAGVISLALVAPKVVKAMQKAGIPLHIRQRETIGISRNKLIKKGFIEFNEGKLQITQKGKIYLATNIFSEKSKEKKWDGKWRMLIFDIPERKRFVRDHIRRMLVSMGFMRLQDSVWIYPHECEEVVMLLKADMKIGKDVLYMIVEALEYDKPVRKYFGFI